MNIIDVENKINERLAEKFFAGIRKIIVNKNKERYIKSTEYLNATPADKKALLNMNYKTWFDSISNFFLSYRSIYALHPLVERELKIRDFVSQEIIRIRADYSYDDVEFGAFYPTHYNSSMTKEIEDCVSDLKKHKEHYVESFISRTDTEKTPDEPLTTTQLKYDAFYLHGFEPEHVTHLASKLFEAGLITNPETNGWAIDNDIVEDIITALNQKFSESKVLQYKRVYSDNKVDRDVQECIRPTIITDEYFPKNVKETAEFKAIELEEQSDYVDLLKLYEYIFYTTLATQMKNSIYDTSAIEITAGDRILKEHAHVIIKGQENWEDLTGPMKRKILNNSDNNRGNHTVVLPEVPVETILKPIDVYLYPYNSRRPHRYGTGRFVVQILEKYAIGLHKQQDEIINELEESKAVKTIKRMMHPQENAVMLITWMKEFMPTLLDLEYFSELNDKIELAAEGGITVQSILEEIDRIVEDAFSASGFIFDEDELPSQKKINLLKSVAAKNNLSISQDVYRSNVKIDMILAKYPAEEPIKIGSCPECNSLVVQKEFVKQPEGELHYYFACEKFNKQVGCKFSLWDSYIHKFFSDKAMELYTVEERAKALTKILSKKKGYLFNGFIAKNSKTYDAKVFAEQYEDRDTKEKKWGLSLDFVNKRKK